MYISERNTLCELDYVDLEDSPSPPEEAKSQDGDIFLNLEPCHQENVVQTRAKANRIRGINKIPPQRDQPRIVHNDSRPNPVAGLDTQTTWK
jgi:hypothetical protein